MSNSGAVVEIRTLVDAMRTDRFTAEQTARLDELVCTNDDACWAYVQQRHQDAVLRMALARQVPGLINPGGLASSPTDDIPSMVTPSRRLWQRLSSRMAEPGAVSLIAATATVAIVLLVLAAFAVPGFRRLNIVEVFTSPDVAPVAQLTGAVDCRWSDEEVTVCDRFSAGRRLQLESGIAEIRFAGGAIMVVEGPAVFRLEEANKAYLERGQANTMVPRRATGFTLGSPLVEAVDLGTEFAMAVDETEMTEVHVFQGLVQLNPTPGSCATFRQKIISQGDALQFTPGSSEPSELKADRQRFACHLPPKENHWAGVFPLTPDAPALKPHLLVWLRADHLTDGATETEPAVGTEVETWFDSSGQGHHGVAAAPSRRPVVDQLDSGIRVVRFSCAEGRNNAGDRIQALDLKGDTQLDDVTIVAVYRSCNTHDQARPLGLGAMDIPSTPRGSHFCFGPDPSLRCDGAAVSSEYYRVAHPRSLFVRTALRRGNVFADFFNGTPALLPTRCQNAQPCRDDLYLGELGIPGHSDTEIAEVLVYDTTLGAEQRKSVEVYLARKYGLIDTPSEESR